VSYNVEAALVLSGRGARLTCDDDAATTTAMAAAAAAAAHGMPIHTTHRNSASHVLFGLTPGLARSPIPSEKRLYLRA
jgi:hypothetical protein